MFTIPHINSGMKYVPCCLFFQVFICTTLTAQETTAISSGTLSPRIYLWCKPVSRDHRNVLQWSVTGTKSNLFYVIERSRNGSTFDLIGVTREAGHQQSFEFVDENPVNQTNYYRIRISITGRKDLFSEVVTVNNNNGFRCRFYPNPVDKLLIVRSELAVQLHISDAVSRVRISRLLAPGLQIVDVSTLERGVYFLTIFDKETNKVITEKLIKN